MRARLALAGLALLAAATLQAGEVSFESAGFKMAGTLDVPAKNVLRAGVLIIPGSGPIDRNGVPRLAPQRPPIYRQWADAMVAAGYTVLRYDKRTLTHPTVDYKSFDEEAQIADAFAAFSRLRSQAYLRWFYVVGHSEGGNLGAVMASRSSAIHGLAVVNSVQFPVDELLLVQLRSLKGVPKSELDEVQHQLQLIRTGAFPKDKFLLGASGAYWAQWIAYSRNSPQTLSRLDIPLLLVQSLADESLPGDTLARNVAQLRAVAKANENARLHELPGLDHSTLRAGAQRVAPQFTQALVKWLDGLR